MTSTSHPLADGYEPGVCNIGAAEIERRRRTGHLGAALTVILFVVLVAFGVPPIARIVVALPAALAAVGYLQARRRFCAGFAMQGVFNLGELGTVTPIHDGEAARRDRASALRLFAEATAVGLLVGIAAVLLPI